MRKNSVDLLTAMSLSDAVNPTSDPLRRAGLLRHRADRRSLLFLVLTLTMLGSSFWVAPEGLAKGVWLLFSMLFCFNACIVNHNHIHSAIFHDTRLNEFFGHLLGMAKGHTSSGVMVAHNLNHHRFHGSDEDWIRTSLAGDGPGFVRLLRFIIKASISMARGRNAADAPTLPRPIAQRLRRERASLRLFVLVLLLIDWQHTAQFIFLPWGLAILMLTGVNLLQHDDCCPSDPYRACRNFTGRFGNWFFLNNGFHTAHHMQPQRHWSELRRYHEEELADRIPDRLNERSIVAYLLLHYLLAPRKSVQTA